MIAEKIQNASKALGALGGQVNENVWAAIKCIRAELTDAADQVQDMETNWPVPELPTAAAIEARRA
ncbi:MAG: hypothetical protein AB9900_04945 [Humidesulfovibrio sp.]